MAIEFEIKSVNYRANKLSAIQQFHVSRKIAPLIPKLIPVFVKLSNSKDGLNNIDNLPEILGPFADSLAQMPDDAAEYVLTTCMSVVSRNMGGVWSPVWNAQNKVLMDSDVDMSVMVPMTVQVIRDSLGNFISGLLSNQSETQPEKT